jgi:hypothetical protein
LETEPIDIGPVLDADDPWEWELEEATIEPIEIGTFHDAGAPLDN